MTKEEIEGLRRLCKESTRVVSWYAHPYDATVRGPFCRWFTCSEVAEQYRHNVASPSQDVHFAAAAMNALPKLLDEVERLTYRNHGLENGIKHEVIAAQFSEHRSFVSRVNYLKEENQKLREALEFVVAHEKTNLEINPDVHRHDRYRENMYFKAREALGEGL